MTILLVEDDSLLALTESHWLTRAGYSVIHSLTGENAIETIKDKKNQIDLILMDINLGIGIDGTKAAQEILKDNDIPLLFLSSHTEKEIVEKTEQITSYGYVIKDSKDVVLIASIKMAFKLHQANRQLRDKEKALKESKERLQRAELVSKTGHWEYHRDSHTMVASEGASKIYGIKALKTDLPEIRKRTLPEYHSLLDTAMKNLIEFNIPYDVEFKIKRKNKDKIIDIHSVAEYDKEENVVFGTIQDITERKNTEKILRESEEKFRAIFENNASAIAIIDWDTTILMVNDAYCRMSGYSREEVVGMSWTQQLPPEDLIRLKEYNRLRSLDQNSVPESYEFSFYKKSGEIGYAYINVSYIQNKQKIVISIVDITERKHVEKEIENSYSILEATLESTEDGILVVDSSGKISKYNRKFAEMLNIPKEILSAKDDNKALEYALNKIKNPDVFFTKVKQLYSQPEAISFDLFELVDGRIFERYSQPQLIGGYAVGRVWSFRDVTERILSEKALRESENMLVTAFQRSPIAISISSEENGMFYDVNEIFLRETGYTRIEVIGHTSLELNIFIDYNERTKLIEEVIKKGFIYDVECHFRKKNGEIILCLISIVKVILGHIPYFLSSILDITARKQSEFQLLEITEALKSVNSAKDKFFSIISHDLKNPFHSINAALKILLSETDSFTEDERTVFLQSILRTSERAYSLLENLLLWSRQQMGNIEFEPEKVEIVEVVVESIQHLEQKAELKKIKVTSTVNNNIFVKADRKMIETVLRNLLANAIKFTRDNGRINIEAFETDSRVRINVIDNGTGIISDDIGKLFRIDQSFSTLGTNGEGGTGLGLIICKDFIEKNEGKIWVESEIGKGSKFSFELPMFRD